MKTTLSLLSIFLISVCPANTLNIAGRVSNINNPDHFGIHIAVYKDKQLIDSTVSDNIGFYELQASTGIYDFKFYQNGFENMQLKHIEIYNNINGLNFGLKMNKSISKSEVKTKNPDTGSTTFRDSVRIGMVSFSSRGSSSDETESTTSSASYSLKSTTISKKGMRSESSYSSLSKGDTKPEKVKAVAKEEAKFDSPKMEELKDKMDADGISEPEIVAPRPEIRPGQITAGHWRDLDHWEEWITTNLPLPISSLMKVWGIYPHTLYSLQLADKKGRALRDVKATLKSGAGNELWTCISDAKGRCYFWVDLFNPQSPLNDFILEAEGVQYPLKREDFNQKKPFKITSESTASNKIEIGFMVDATGSMGDELKYLQVEIIDVISRIKKERPCSELLTGSVFYKDHGDEYVTKVMPMKSNPEYNISFIGEQKAGGGGDFAEAVEEGLRVSIDDLGWSETPSTKILFMILDASPHSNNEEHKAKVRKYIELAARKGIRLVPVASSGIDKATEFLLKYMAIASNGEYIYITDDSHIGDTHLKPTGGESKVEYLNDLMVNLILDYSAIDCHKPVEIIQRDTFRTQVLTQAQIDSIKQHETHIEINGSNELYMKFYPNPAKDILLIEFSESFEQLVITDINGRELYSNTTSGQTQISMNISSWNSGLYVVYVQKGDKRITGKLLVMH